jgi:hypothetical protein
MSAERYDLEPETQSRTRSPSPIVPIGFTGSNLWLRESPTTGAAVRLNEHSRYNCLCGKCCDRTDSCLATFLVG